MTRLPAPPPIAAPGIAAICALLHALLAALLGVDRPRARALAGVLDCALPLAAEIDLESEPEVEWILVPAPWRAGRWWVKPRRGAHVAASPCQPGPRAARVRAPPYSPTPSGDPLPGMA